MDLLILLVERRMELVSRHEIGSALWGNDVFVEVDSGVHTAIRKIRHALNDSADRPKFLETVSGKGYRFIAPVEVSTQTNAEEWAPSDRRLPERALPERLPEASSVGVASGSSPLIQNRRSRYWWFGLPAVGALAVAIIFGGAARIGHSGSVSRPAVTLAVLPFENLTGDPDRQYLADGLAEETIATLGQLDPARLGIIGRTSVMTYKGTTKSLAVIGRELEVDYLLEGAIRTEGSRVRLTSRLIRAGDQVQLWSASFERELTSLFDLQKELSTGIAEQIRVRLSPEQLNTLVRRQTTDSVAYEMYLKGRFVERQRTATSNMLAVQHFQNAIAADPKYALAWAGLADTIATSAINSDTPTFEVAAQARVAAAKAIEIGPSLSESHTSMARVHFWFDWNWPAAEAALETAIRLNTGNAEAHRMLGVLYSHTRRHQNADIELERSTNLDQLNPIQHAIASEGAFRRGDHAAALVYARRALAVNPNFWIGHMVAAQAHERNGEYDLALKTLDDADRLSGGNSKPVSLRGYVFAKAGRPTDARAVITALEAAGRHRYVPPYALALVFAGLDDRDAAFAWLERALAVHDVHMVFLTVDPKWDPYRNDPRFKALLARCRFTAGAP
jgi:TolB-like protein/DNA-binding winged helix-turn-helix (wHTH) protein/tetratricopeptide (TPR) repeat protein